MYISGSSMASVVSPFDDTPEVVSAQQLKLRVTIAVHGLLNQIDLQANKGSLISESFSLWLNPPNNVPNH